MSDRTGGNGSDRSGRGTAAAATGRTGRGRSDGNRRTPGGRSAGSRSAEDRPGESEGGTRASAGARTGTDATHGTVDHRTNHWRGVGAVALFMCGLGVLFRESGLVLAGVLGVVYAGYAGTAEPPTLRDAGDDPVLELRREVGESSPEPGDDVEVTVGVRNAGEGFLPDVRLVDGVPSELEVVDGSARHATALRPGGTDAFSYTVTATRGEHDWRPTHVVAADPSGAVERETRVDCETSLRCTLAPLSTDELPLRGLTTPYTGRVETDSGGAGVEFYATREYRPSDPLKRIDWYRRAKTGELGTLEFREERAATVVLLIDARKAAYLAPEPTAPHAVERSVDAANRIFSALLDTGDRVGIDVLGPESGWLAPGAGDDHRAHGRELLTTHPSLSSLPPERGRFETYRADRRAELRRRRIDRLHQRLSDDAQVLVLSPCCDEYVPEAVRRLDAYGHAVTVVSPDPTADDEPWRRLVGMERADRLRQLRREDVRVVDWAHGESFDAALARARARWSA